VSAALTAEQRLAAHDFLIAEAEALDERRYGDWLGLLADDVRYRMPVRVTVHAGGESALAGMDHFDEDRYTLGKRVERLSGEHAWTEDPPSRVRRFVTNVRCAPGPGPDEIAVRSYLLLFRSRGDVRPPEWVAAERRDVLRAVDGSLRLRAREITEHESVLRTQNLALFL
jgi:phthalate 3,4-dioxygenase beta subunit